jgi:hypothetical protein
MAPAQGALVLPEGLHQYSRTFPFLGSLRCSHGRLVTGTWDEILLDYIVGESGIADGARLKIAFKFYTDWALFQTSDPGAANFVSAEYTAGPLVAGQSPSTVQSLKISFDQKGHERPFQKALVIDVVDGYLNPGDRITIRLGDRRAGGPGTRVQTFAERGYIFRAFIDPLGTSRFARVPGDVKMDFVPGPPSCLSIVTPRLVRTDERIPVYIRAFDKWGNCCLDLDRVVELEIASDTGEPAQLANMAFPKEGWATARFELPTGLQNKEFKLRARLAGEQSVAEASALIRVQSTCVVPRVWFADLHVHSDDTVGINNTEYNLTYGRDVAGLDVLGYTANDFNVTGSNWNKAVDLVHAFNTDGAFVCFPGTEWCGNSCAGGDHNVIFLHDGKPEFPFTRSGQSARSFEWNAEMKDTAIEPHVQVF